AFQVGVLQVLNEAGYEYEVISGISVGSLNGAMMATDQFEQLVRVWQNITPQQVYREQSLLGLARRYLTYKLGLGRPPVSKYNNAPLRRLMEKHFLGKPLSVPFKFGYVQLESGEYVKAVIPPKAVVDQNDVSRVLASTAIPVVFNPVSIGDFQCVDGGVRDISPIRQVLPNNPDRVVIIPTQPVGAVQEHEEVRDIISIAFRAIHIMLDEIFHEDIDRFLTINNLVQQAGAAGAQLKRKNGIAYQYIEPLIIAPKKPLGSALDFDHANVVKMMELGRQRAKEVLSRNGQVV
ncbi:MAG TPA: patatin-like phospholipase family protein, partial [Balneolaceae bacterium]|nr:patatin-like phospholipase family protein [Balneolaceae bacterium]